METLRVGAAFPDPPFNGMPDNAGLDIDLMTEIAKALGATVEFMPYEGTDFNGIFDALELPPTTASPRARRSLPTARRRPRSSRPTSSPDSRSPSTPRRLPNVKSIDDLAGLTIGVQQGNTSQPIADRLVAEGKAARVRVYDYGSIRTALTDLTTGACDAFMKLAPVLTELVKPIAGVEVVQRGISVENIAIAVRARRPGATRPHHSRSGRARRHGTLQRIRGKWLGIRTSIRAWPSASDQPARGEYHTTRLAVEHQGKRGRDK